MSNVQANNFGAAYAPVAMNMDLRKPFHVTKLHGKIRTTRVEVTKEEMVLRGGKTKIVSRFKPVEALEDAGYLVEFPNGHSIRVRNEEELARQGFNTEPGLIDMLSGEVFTPNMKLMAKQVDLLKHLPPEYMAATGDETVKLDGELKPRTSRSRSRRRNAETTVKEGEV